MKNKLKILIIDDMLADANYLKRIISKLPLWESNIEMAVDSTEGLKICRELHPDVIFVDYLLGAEYGVNIIKQFSEMGINASFVLLTAFGSESVVTEALRAGASDYISKNERTTENIDRTLRHIFQKKQADEKLRKTETKLKTIIENTRTGIITIDIWGNIIEANAPYLDLVGRYLMEQVIGHSIFEWTASKYIPKMKEFMQEALQNNGFDDKEVAYIKPSGETVYILLNAATEYVDNEVFISLLCRDLTFHKLAEEQLLLAKQKAEESDRLKSAFLSTISHEVRTPLNVIQQGVTVLKEEDSTDEVKEMCFQYIENNINILLRMFSDMLDIAGIESKQFHLKKQRFSVYSLLEKLLKTFETEKIVMEKSFIDLRISISEENKNLEIFTDEESLFKVFSHLIRNAIKFTDKGFIEFGYKISRHNYVDFFVIDTGIGIKAEKIPYIFDVFRKTNEDKNRLFAGTGIGLTLVKKILSTLDGEINVVSEPQKGSTFHFSIQCL